MSAFREIKDQIISKINGITQVQKVYPYEKVNPGGWPCVFVKGDDMEGEFASTAENSRVYSYAVLVLFPLGQNFVPDSEKDRADYAEIAVADVIDSIINAVDTDYELASSPVLYVEAANFVWGTYSYEGGEAKSGLITLRVYTEKNVRE